ncbi:DUF6455 family protein [Shimia sp.]|uniref:DUF6455 family protein n=1 Tax=Shimia sp. TaxID=1954381 RepID=UPI003297095A
MGLFDKLNKHSDLVGEMSDRVGVDWEKALQQRPELAEQYRSAVLKCTQCRDVGACQGWLKTHDHADDAPDYCKNQGLFAELQGK